MNWQKGTYFSIAVFGYRGWWVVLEDKGKNAKCLHLKGSDPRLYESDKTWLMPKGWFDYGGRIEKPTLKLKFLHWLKK